ncbi:hypothetical protein [Alkalicoccobacillus porphyridii]|uniref:Uncharacterized protein n=1 Tax=Alkalicoccobacillus porphyridii TaxID=2597270 RepID=A0A554A2A3_9BACI|nr:hypothetical protein [Alkalicoccobacillus porphyridii]TSB47817.1 hypothetical protein FN960_04685 [Alkalicoccobacillus porphyridii]
MKKTEALTLGFFISAFIFIILRGIDTLSAEPSGALNLWYAVLANVFFAVAVCFVIVRMLETEKKKKFVWVIYGLWLLPVSLVATAVVDLLTILS